MTTEARIQEILTAGAVLTIRNYPGLRHLLAHAEIPREGVLFWVPVFPQSQRDFRALPFDDVREHGQALRLLRNGEDVAFLTTALDTPEMDTDEAAETLARWQETRSTNNWDATVARHRKAMLESEYL